MKKTLGIIGGLGPETSCKFCLSVNNKFQEISQNQPNIILENLPVSRSAERKIITGGASKEHFNLLSNSVERLNKMVDFLVIPCNTVHIFINELRRKSSVPILSIIEETAKECKKRNLKKVALLASTKTVEERLHQKELNKDKIKVVLPSKVEQKKISNIILKIIHHKNNEEDKTFLFQIVKKLEKEGAEAVILGCTELPLAISSELSVLPIINTLSILENAAVSKLITH